jgi:hypothetical protein
MKNPIFSALTGLLLIALFSGSCTKNNVAPAVETASGTVSGLQNIVIPDVLIDSAQSHVFCVPLITQDIVSTGTVAVFASGTEEQIPQWQSLPIISGCHQQLQVVSVSVGKVEVQNNLGAPVSMSFRFNIVPGQ